MESPLAEVTAAFHPGILDLDLEDSWHLTNLFQPINIHLSILSQTSETTKFMFLPITALFQVINEFIVIGQRHPNIISQEGRKRP